MKRLLLTKVSHLKVSLSLPAKINLIVSFIFIPLWGIFSRQPLVAQTFSVVGTGTTSSSTSGFNPYYNLYYGQRCQFFVTAAQLSAAGVPAGATINSVGFNIVLAGSGSSATLNGWTLRVRTTTSANPLTSWLTTGLVATSATTNLSVNTTGWNQTSFPGFVWNGTDNLVIETCFNNTGWSPSYARVQCTTTGLGTATWSRWYSADITTVCSSTAVSSTSTTSRPNIRFGWILPTACSGTPAASNTISSANPVCTGANFILSLSTTYTETGITYQWQSADDAAFTVGVTNLGMASTQVTSQTSAKWYRCIITCTNSGQFVVSTPIQVNMASDACTQCAYSTIFPSSNLDTEISSVTVGTMTNSLNTCTTPAPGPGSIAGRYANFTTTVTGPSASTGSSVNFSVTQATCGSTNYNNLIQIYVDWNQNGVFENSERMAESAVGLNTTPFTGSFTVPMTALTGSTRMRILCVESGTAGINYTTTSWGGTSWGEVEDYCFTVTAAVPCAGTPAASTTVSSSAYVCPSANFTLSLSTTYTETGITYQWQSADDAGFSVNLTNLGTAATQVTSQTSAKWYRCIITCTNSGQFVVSTPILVDMDSPVNCLPYCIPTYTYGKTDGDLISQVQITGTTLNNNTGTAPVNPAYTFFPPNPPGNTQTADLVAGTNYNINVTYGSYSGQHCAVWIDFNANGTFETSERVGFSTAASTSAFQTVSFPLSIPCNPTPGTYRMRVRNVWNTPGNIIDPCANYGYGETEDYNVTILPPPPCPQVPAASISISSVTATSASVNWTPGCVETSWNIEYGAPGFTPGTGTLITGVNSSPYTISGLSPSTPYQVLVYANCGSNGLSAPSASAPFTTPAPPPANDDIAGAIPVTCGSVTAGTTVSATQGVDENTTCGTTVTAPGVWYSFVGTGTTITVNTCAGASYDTKLNVYTGTSGSLTCVAGNDDACGLQSSVTFNSIAGTNYLILVQGFGGQTGTFQLSVSCSGIWTGNISTAWGVAGNWSDNTVPAAGADVVIPDVSLASNNFPLISTPVTVNNLTVDPGASVTVAPGAGLILDGTLTNNGTFTLQSDASGTAWFDDFSLGGTVVGNISVQRFNPIGLAGFRQLGSPVAMPNMSGVSGFTPSGTPGQIIPDPSCNPNYIAWNSPYGNWMELAENNPVLVPGCAQSLFNVLTSGGMTPARGYYMDVPGGSTLTFTGPPNTGTISNTTPTWVNGAVSGGWNLVANPYPSPLRWEFSDVPAGYDAIGKIWVTSGAYTGTWQDLDPAAPGIQAVAIGQGFQVKVSTPNTTPPFTLTNASRITTPPTYLFSGGAPLTLNIDITGNGFADLAKVRFIEGATNGYDAMYDSPKVLGNPVQPMVYSIWNGQNLSTNTFGELSGVYTVPLGVKTGTAGTYNFVFSNTDQFPASAFIYLEDVLNGTMQDVRLNDTYTFSLTAGTTDNRFLLHFYPPVKAEAAQATCESGASVTLTELAPASWGFTVKDAQNQPLASGQLEGTAVVNNLPAGSYTLILTELNTGYVAEETFTVNGPAQVTAQASASVTVAEPGQEIQFTASAQNADTYAWNFGDGNTSYDMNPVHLYNAPGTYQVTLTASNSDCSGTSELDIQVNGAFAGKEDAFSQNGVNLWNDDNTVFIHFEHAWEGKTVFTLYDAQGKRVLNKQINHALGTVTIDCGVLAAGTYTAELKGNGMAITRKIVMAIR